MHVIYWHISFHIIFIIIALLLHCRATLDLNLRHVESEMSTLREQQSRLVRDKDIELRRLKKALQQLKSGTESLQAVQLTQRNKHAEVTAAGTF